jgi:hypothetical protein
LPASSVSPAKRKTNLRKRPRNYPPTDSQHKAKENLPPTKLPQQGNTRHMKLTAKPAKMGNSNPSQIINTRLQETLFTTLHTYVAKEGVPRPQHSAWEEENKTKIRTPPWTEFHHLPRWRLVTQWETSLLRVPRTDRQNILELLEEGASSGDQPECRNYYATQAAARGKWRSWAPGLPSYT